MSAPLDELYFTWLYGKVCSVKLRDRSKTHNKLLRQLFRTKFVWLISNDDNRMEDGLDLRDEFLEHEGLDPDPEWMRVECSVLEMLIGLSRRLAFAADEGGARDWFWIMLENLGVAEFNDSGAYPEEEVGEIIENLIWRQYRMDGRGGLFPLENPQSDQRKVELWYQANAYLLEHE